MCMSISYCVEVNVQLASRDKLITNFLLLLPTMVSRLACTHIYYPTEYLLPPTNTCTGYLCHQGISRYEEITYVFLPTLGFKC